MNRSTADGGPTVLVVDDDPLQRREIVRCLEDCDIDAIETDNGLSALSVIIIKRPLVIIMDIKMPVIDGIETVRQIDKISDYDPKIVLITGDPESLYRANKMHLHVFGIVEKPLPLRVLLRFVRGAINENHSGVG